VLNQAVPLAGDRLDARVHRTRSAPLGRMSMTPAPACAAAIPAPPYPPTLRSWGPKWVPADNAQAV